MLMSLRQRLKNCSSLEKIKGKRQLIFIPELDSVQKQGNVKKKNPTKTDETET